MKNLLCFLAFFALLLPAAAQTRIPVTGATITTASGYGTGANLFDESGVVSGSTTSVYGNPGTVWRTTQTSPRLYASDACWTSIQMAGAYTVSKIFIRDVDGIGSMKVQYDSSSVWKTAQIVSLNNSFPTWVSVNINKTTTKLRFVKLSQGANASEVAMFGTFVNTDVTPPSAPTALASASITETSFTLNWTAATDNVAVTGYDVYRDGTLALSVGNVTTANLTGLGNGVTYSMTVKAKDAAGNVSTASSALSVTTLTTSPILTTNFYEGNRTVDVENTLNVAGKVYYVVYTSAQTLTAAQVRSAARSGAGVARDSVTFASAGLPAVLQTKTGLTENTNYYLYAAGQSTGGSYTSVFFSNKTTHQRLVRFTFTHSGVSATRGGYVYYNENYYKKYPAKQKTLLFFHGDNEAGSDVSNTQIDKLLTSNGGLPDYLNQGNDIDYLVVMPQRNTTGGDVWSASFIDPYYTQATTTYNGDVNKVSLTGLSGGGGACYTYAYAYPTRIASMVVCAGVQSLSNPSGFAVIKGIPSWLFHNNVDGTVGPGNSDSYYNYLTTQTLSYTPRYTKLNQSGHGSWTEAYSNTFSGTLVSPGTTALGTGIYVWMAQYSTSSDTQAPTVPTALAASAVVETGFTLSWTASTDNVGVTGYDIYSNGSLAGSSSGNSYNVSGLIGTTTYAMTVRAKDAGGNASAQSSSLNVTTATGTGSPTLEATWILNFGGQFSTSVTNYNNLYPSSFPLASGTSYSLVKNDGSSSGVSFVTTSAISGGGTAAACSGSTGYADNAINSWWRVDNSEVFTANFTGLNGAKSYKVKLLNNNGTNASVANYTLTGTTTQTASVNGQNNCGTTTALISDIIPVSGVIGFQLSRNSGYYEAGINVLELQQWSSGTPADTQAPTTPTGIAASNIGSTSFTLNWTASTDNVGVTSYDIILNGTTIGTPSTNTFAVTGRTASTLYVVTIRAKDAAGNVSSQSSSINVTTTAPGTGPYVLTLNEDNIYLIGEVGHQATRFIDGDINTVWSPIADGDYNYGSTTTWKDSSLVYGVNRPNSVDIILTLGKHTVSQIRMYKGAGTATSSGTANDVKVYSKGTGTTVGGVFYPTWTEQASFSMNTGGWNTISTNFVGDTILVCLYQNTAIPTEIEITGAINGSSGVPPPLTPGVMVRLPVEQTIGANLQAQDPPGLFRKIFGRRYNGLDYVYPPYGNGGFSSFTYYSTGNYYDNFLDQERIEYKYGNENNAFLTPLNTPDFLNGTGAFDWSSGTSYAIGSRVRYNNSGDVKYYKAVASSTNQNPVSNTTYWAISYPLDSDIKPVSATQNKPSGWIGMGVMAYNYGGWLGFNTSPNMSWLYKASGQPGAGQGVTKRYMFGNEIMKGYKEDINNNGPVGGYHSIKQSFWRESMMIDGHKGAYPYAGVKNADPNARVISDPHEAAYEYRTKAKIMLWALFRPGDAYPYEEDAYHYYATTQSRILQVFSFSNCIGLAPEIRPSITGGQSLEDAYKRIYTFGLKYLQPRGIKWIFSETGYDRASTSPTAVPTISGQTIDETHANFTLRQFLTSHPYVHRAVHFMMRNGSFSSALSGYLYQSSGAAKGWYNGTYDEYLRYPTWYYTNAFVARNTGFIWQDSTNIGSNVRCWNYNHNSISGFKTKWVWSPTQQNRSVTVSIPVPSGATSAWLVTPTNLDYDGVRTSLTISGGNVSVTATEKPVAVQFYSSSTYPAGYYKQEYKYSSGWTVDNGTNGTKLVDEQAAIGEVDFNENSSTPTSAAPAGTYTVQLSGQREVSKVYIYGVGNATISYSTDGTNFTTSGVTSIYMNRGWYLYHLERINGNAGGVGVQATHLKIVAGAAVNEIAVYELKTNTSTD